MKDPIKIASPVGTHVAKATINCNNPSIVILSDSGVDEGAYFPAQDINFYGKKTIEELRDFCSKVLETFEKDYKS